MNHNTYRHTQAVLRKNKSEESGPFINFFIIPFIYGLIGLIAFYILMDNILSSFTTFHISLRDYQVSLIGFIYGFLFGIFQNLIDKFRK